ncbi:MAG TPA: tRNA (adenosine(37)-N6)-threonylcarbamoyltransferase complex dimerization subunit type 1 TsaB [Bacteroidetes bacterium]|nr:tRNA (adenosine(37)-N6)-threonylcarbamoyltransferase complex dimerization subunit type 1 TsaB [Bacteroidota bacterium]
MQKLQFCREEWTFRDVIILGLETSTAVCSVGLYRTGVAELEQSIQESHIHSEKLLTLVQQVTGTAGITLHQLDAIAVSIGPGSFTGLRIGLSTAKGMAFALDKPLVAVPTFDAIAESGRQWHTAVKSLVVLVDAKKDEWFARAYRIVDGAAEAAGRLAISDLGAVVRSLTNESSTLVLTDKVSELRKIVGEAVQVEDVHPYCRGSVVAALGAKKAAAGEFAGAAALEPLYLKDFLVRTLPASA